ncbi:hypothetical protein VTK73DRAFT_10184 [Phialemonium thermophilum]|uniref:N-acetylgalactosaminide beta-1,3-galactosyltransferase n=1 Tax=Phialemonium thermophilum TaxID=223376 RepID=A0ABR3XHU4_9PEZI
MRWTRLARSRRLVSTAFGIVAVWTLLLWLFTPYDHPAILWLRFVRQKAAALTRSPLADQKWLAKPARFRVDWDADVALIIKTGYATQARVAAQLHALDLLPERDGHANSIVVGDFAAEVLLDTVRVPIHDVVATIANDKTLVDAPGRERLVKYKSMSDAIASGDVGRAQKIGREIGWELDALKFIPGLELAYQQMPNRKWYIMLDDDTYVFRPTLRAILAHIDPSKPAYLGNAIGDFKGRFAHGGSAILLSGAAMRKVFGDNRHIVPAARLRSLTETWGDKLVATTFMKAGVYLDERYSHFFNGERPSITRIRPDRFCSPIVSFHGLAQPSQMDQVGELFRDVGGILTWGRLWEICGQPPWSEMPSDYVRTDEDHVGRTDESTLTTPRVGSPEDCARMCNRHYASCLAWTWDSSASKCHISPWVIVGEKAPGRHSGLNMGRLKSLHRACTS